jgi:hypothetical protein
MSTAAETKLLLAIVTSAELTSISWDTVGSKLNCNDKAARERFRKFKLKFPLPADYKGTDSETQLLLALVSSAQVSGIDWAKVGTELGCNDKAARERYRKFKVRLEKKNGGGGEQQAVDGGAVKKGEKRKAVAKTTKSGGAKKPRGEEKILSLSDCDEVADLNADSDSEGGVRRSPAKRARVKKYEKVYDELEDEAIKEETGEEVAAKGGHVGGVNGLAEKRAQVVNEKKTEGEGVKEESGEGFEGEGPERENAEIHEAEEVYAGEGPEYEI